MCVCCHFLIYSSLSQPPSACPSPVSAFDTTTVHPSRPLKFSIAATLSPPYSHPGMFYLIYITTTHDIVRNVFAIKYMQIKGVDVVLDGPSRSQMDPVDHRWPGRSQIEPEKCMYCTEQTNPDISCQQWQLEPDQTSKITA
jgi:hypothetical protein